MCHRCDYPRLLTGAGLDATPKRTAVLASIGDHDGPLSAREVFHRVTRRVPINRVTVYRILDRLVTCGLVERLSGGGRAFFYGLAPNAHHRPHPHFYCTRCGSMACLRPESLVIDSTCLKGLAAGWIEHIEIRADGICRHCLNRAAGT